MLLYHPSRHDARGAPLKKCITRGHWELEIAARVRWDGIKACPKLLVGISYSVSSLPLPLQN